MDQLIKTFGEVYQLQEYLDELLRKDRNNPTDKTNRDLFFASFDKYKQSFDKLKKDIVNSGENNFWLGYNLDSLTSNKPFIIDNQKNSIYYRGEHQKVFRWFLGGFE